MNIISYPAEILMGERRRNRYRSCGLSLFSKLQLFSRISDSLQRKPVLCDVLSMVLKSDTLLPLTAPANRLPLRCHRFPPGLLSDTHVCCTSLWHAYPRMSLNVGVGGGGEGCLQTTSCQFKPRFKMAATTTAADLHCRFAGEGVKQMADQS